MRIIAGKAGRIAIKVPSAVARPTTDFVRQAVFSILQDRVENAKVLDLFAGSGALGLEALSRGASSCTFVDDNRQAIATVTANLGKAHLTGGHAVKSDVAAFLKRDISHYDLIFADPPYWKHHGDKDHIAELLNNGTVLPRLTPDGWFIVEISSRQDSPSGIGFTLVTRREYGSSAILIYAPASSGEHHPPSA
jgi:16S rRNA (guanine966-N2)-methyltransferase